MEKKLIFSLAALSALGLGSVAHAARGAEACAPEPPTTCYPDDCTRCYCLGPDNYGVNAPVCPRTCNGDFAITLAGFYWNAHQDGMEYAVRNQVAFPITLISGFDSIQDDVLALNNLIASEFQTPHYKWDFGFKLGLSYCFPCDGWDFGVEWTWYQGKANGKVQTEPSDNATLLPIWSAFASTLGGPNFVSEIQHRWDLDVNLIDIELGRNFWTSKYLAIRPFVGLRIAYLNQDWDLQHKGGVFSAIPGPTIPLDQPAQNNYVRMHNDFHGVGARAGLDTTWNLGCGWALYGDMATSIVYGKFDVEYKEENRQATEPHVKSNVAEYQDSFRASRAMLDLALGIQWTGMFCECQYGLTVALGWEHHMFFDQNQLWRVNRIGNDILGALNPQPTLLPNNSGENAYYQRRGDLDTQGWTLTVDFMF